MKFGEELRSSRIPAWEYHYISYDDLKRLLVGSRGLKSKTMPWTEEDERSFVARLEAELDKVYTFKRVKSGEIARRIQSSEQEVNEVVVRLKQPGPAEQGQEGLAEDSEQEISSDEDFRLLEYDLSDIIADVNDLDKFTNVNYTGFQKIIKKHDKVTGWISKPAFQARLQAKPFFKNRLDPSIHKLSKLFNLVQTRGNPIMGDSAAGGEQQNFVRETTKYWVHPDNITELKLIILKVMQAFLNWDYAHVAKHLPVLVFNASKELDTKDSAISSIYYDNTDTWELYEGRLKKTEGAEAVRLRWYGGMDTEQIFVERKTHREDWTGEKSVKARFMMKEKNVNAFMSGRLPAVDLFKKMRNEGKRSEKEISNLERLAIEVQHSVVSKHFVPVTRSFYNRTAFQLPGDARVRISLDTELAMVREDNLDGKSRAGKNWRRMDIGIDHPFSQLSTEDKELFPYAVLEIKLQTQAGQEPPGWVRELVSSHLVEAVPKFSKFIHGTATLFPSRINLIPFWMPQMDVDIRKPAIRRFGIQRPGMSASYTTSSDDDLDDSDDEYEEDSNNSETLQGHSNPDSDESIRRLRENRDALERSDQERSMDLIQQHPNELDIEEQIGASPVTAMDDYPLYDSDDQDLGSDAIEEARRIGGWHYRIELLKHHASNASQNLAKVFTPLPSKLRKPGALDPLDSQTVVRPFRAPKGKRIHVPVRVEPKVFFATERTFLSWLEFSIYIGGTSGFLLNFGTDISVYASLGFTIVACAALLYSVGLYLWRVRMIRKRRAVRYHDPYGPTVLCLMFVFVTLLVFVLKYRQGGSGESRSDDQVPKIEL